MNYRKTENKPILADIMPNYKGKIVRIGTDGSGYFVCGKWGSDLLKDLNWWEDERKRMKAATIEKFEADLAASKIALPKLKRKLPKLEKEVEEAVQHEQEMTEKIGKQSMMRSRRRTELPMIINRYLDKKAVELEANIKELNPREQRQARRNFNTMARNRKRQFDMRLKKYIYHLDRKDVVDIKKLDTINADTEKVKDQLDELKKRISNAKTKIETYPSKIRQYRKYLETYTPFMERKVMETYLSVINPEETSIIIYGREQGLFWDVDEFNKWKKTGTLSRD